MFHPLQRLLLPPVRRAAGPRRARTIRRYARRAARRLFLFFLLAAVALAAPLAPPASFPLSWFLLSAAGPLEGRAVPAGWPHVPSPAGARVVLGVPFAGSSRVPDHAWLDADGRFAFLFPHPFQPFFRFVLHRPGCLPEVLGTGSRVPLFSRSVDVVQPPCRPAPAPGGSS